MKIKLLAFGIAKDIIGSNKTIVEIDPPYKLTQFRAKLFLKYPELKKLQKISFAVDQDYQPDSFVLSENQEVVIIPPVSGG